MNVIFVVLILKIGFYQSIIKGTYCNSTLQLAHVMFRHAERTPDQSETYPMDPYQWETFSRIGWGQLTKAGKQSAYALGKMLRNRFDAFLGAGYVPGIVMPLSTDFDRTKTTLLLVLAGLWPPATDDDKWNANVAWMPIPYHFDQNRYDYFLKRPNEYCPKYTKELETVLQSEGVQHDLKMHRALFQYMAKHTQTTMNTFMDTFRIYQTLNAEETMNLTLPQWTKPVYFKWLHSMAAKQCFYENYNTVLKRLNGGRMLSRIIQTMTDRINEKLVPKHRKLYLYSGHENNVINVLAALQIFEPPHVPKFTATVSIELHFDDDLKTHTVKIFYWRHVNSEPEQLSMPDCDISCPFSKFVQIIQPHLTVNYTLECESRINLDEYKWS